MRSSRGKVAEGQDQTGSMLPKRQGRRFAAERVFVRLVATAGIVGIGVLLGAILSSNKVDGWIIGLVIAIVSVVLAGLLWSSRQL
jgi:protein-S-isoprenylcysteine O-methyltransferase Ste14